MNSYQPKKSMKEPSGKLSTGKVFKSNSGFTLAELLIAALIAFFAIAAGFELVIDQNQNHIIQRGITDMQQNARSTIDELVEKIRQAGYLVPSGVPCLASWDTNPDTIAISFLEDPVCTATISDDMPQPSAELKLTGSDLGCYQDDTWAYIFDPSSGTGEYFYITAVQEGSGHIQHNTSELSKSYPKGSRVFVLQTRKYYIDNVSDTLHPRFMMEKFGEPPVIYSDEIVDLQFHYFMGNGISSDTVMIDRFVRKVLMQVLARTENRDLFLNDYRYDTLQTIVTVRNLAL